MNDESPHAIRTVCVYCGSSSGKNPAFRDLATELGTALAGAGLGLVYGGGDRGLMGAVARAVLAGGGAVTGVIPEFLQRTEQPDGAQGLADMKLITVPDMHTRKQVMFERADAFVALPGGIGTLEELVEILTWSQLSRHSKPVGLLDAGAFWTPFLTLLDHMETAGFLHNPAGARPTVHHNADDLVKQFTA